MGIEGQGHFFTIYFPGFVCFVLYLAKISGERLQDHWSSGLYFVSVMFADHSATYAEKWSNRPHLASCCGSYHVGNENEELQSS